MKYKVYADIAVVVELDVEAGDPEEALRRGDRLFNALSDEEIMRRGAVGAPLAGAFEVRNARGDSAGEGGIGRSRHRGGRRGAGPCTRGKHEIPDIRG